MLFIIQFHQFQEVEFLHLKRYLHLKMGSTRVKAKHSLISEQHLYALLTTLKSLIFLQETSTESHRSRERERSLHKSLKTSMEDFLCLAYKGVLSGGPQ